MDDAEFLQPQIFEELKLALQAWPCFGDLLTPEQIDRNKPSFFAADSGRQYTESLMVTPLLRAMHGRENVESRCLAYWL